MSWRLRHNAQPVASIWVGRMNIVVSQEGELHISPLLPRQDRPILRPTKALVVAHQVEEMLSARELTALIRYQSGQVEIRPTNQFPVLLCDESEVMTEAELSHCHRLHLKRNQ